MRRSVTLLAAAPTGTGSAETVIATVFAPLGNSGEALPIAAIIEANVVVTAGTSTTATTLKIRKGSTTSGSQIDNGNQIQSAAGAAATPARQQLSATDATSQPGQEYVLTITQASGAAAGAVTGFLTCSV